MTPSATSPLPRAAAVEDRERSATVSTAAELLAVLRRHDPDVEPAAFDDPAVVGPAARNLVRSGVLRSVPRPGEGATRRRLSGLAALGELDLAVAKLVEPHLDAEAILVELGGPRPAPGLWGVWAAEPPTPRLTARRTAGGWRLDGTKPWCSGAGWCDHALVTADTGDGPRLFAVTLDDDAVEPLPPNWNGLGMTGTDTRAVRFDAVAAEPVGGPDEYASRAGLWHGGVGIAAVWSGGATSVAETLREFAAARPEPHPHLLAHLGAVDAALHTAAVVLDAAADGIDRAPADLTAARRRALRVRHVIERTVAEVIDRVGRALGPGPLAHDRSHARRVADLQLFVRQSHAEHDLELLGRSLVEEVRG